MDLPEHFIHQATRYCLGRMSYAVGEHCRWLVDNWFSIPNEEQAIIKRDVEEAFERDDDSRRYADSYFPLGMDMDRAEWEKVRKIWQENT